MTGRRFIPVCFLLICSLGLQPLYAQLGFDLDIKKPEKFENRELKAEKTGQKKFKAHRRVMQNMTTHYNYFFNANNKINQVIDRAKAAQRDDYASLLSFYSYTLENTAREKEELDSVIYKSKTGIVLHDLRNDWVDDLYLLWGAAYYLQKQYDSAYQMFQFINYAFAEKEKDGYYKYIGSRMDGNEATSIATEEKISFPKSIIADAPSRNQAFIWLIRTYIQSGNMVEAGSLMETLKNDPVFPKHLQNDLEEVQAFWYYKQARWDSAAAHLEKALSNAATNADKARWEYLLGQLFERAGQWEQSAAYYSKAIVHTTNPIMDIYARLNLIRVNKTGTENAIEENLAELLKMARRDKYEDYRDVIYYMAAQMELERKNYAAAEQYFLKSAQYKNGNLSSSNQGFLHLADLFYQQKNYPQAARYYDSVRIENLLTEDAQRISERKALLSPLVAHLSVIERQDSLQRIAALPESEREAFIKKQVRQLRRQQGLQDEGAPTTGIARANTDALATDLFGKEAKGEWYFYNNTLKTSGAAAFKQVWGNRQNTDNWRRSSNAVAQLRTTSPDNTRGVPPAGTADGSTMLSYDALLANVPLKPEQLQASNDSIAHALYALGRMYTDAVQDYQAAVTAYETLRQRFPAFGKNDEVLFQLYYSYLKTGNDAKAAEVKQLLNTQHPGSRYATIVTTGNDPAVAKAPEAVTKTYEGIYDLFLEGRFEEAKRAKQLADSTYQTTYWQPQLLYIEAVYHIKQREDSLAKGVLNTLIQQSAGQPIAQKATNLLQVLARRQQIEQELTALQIQRPVEDETTVVYDAVTKVAIDQPSTTKDTTAAQPKPLITQPAPKPVTDTVVTIKPATSTAPAFTYKPETVHYAVVVLNKVDVVFGNETKNAFNRYHREKYYNRTLQMDLVPVDEDNKLLVIGEFANVQDAVDYLQKTKPIAAAQIVPWLKSDKYTFTLISADNLQVLKANHDLKGYSKFLDQNLPIKF